MCIFMLVRDTPTPGQEQARAYTTTMASSSTSTDDDVGPVKKKKKVYCHFKSAWRSQEFTVTVGGTEKTVSGTILSGVEGADNAKCTACGVSFSVRHGGANDIVKHFSTKGHWQAVNAKSSSSTLARYGFGHSDEALKARKKKDEQQMQVQRAEAMFIQFVAEHNMSFRTGDHFSKLVKCMFPDSEVARQFQCARTKTSVLTRFGNGKFCQDQLIERLTSDIPVHFSLLVDESNDRGVEAKDLVVLLRFFDTSIMKAVTRFIDLPTANDGTAAAIFAKIDECLVSRGLQYQHLICFNSDTCNTMKGQRNGVVRHLRDQQPDVLDLGCICHLENLALKAAMKSLPIKVDSLLVDINTHFYMSVKRKDQLKEFCDFVNVTYKKILAHVETRWLSLLRVIARILEIWPALKSYFESHPDSEKPGRVRNITIQMCDDTTKLFLLFLSFLLPTVNAFSTAFQATTYTTIHQLHPEMSRLTKRILCYFVDAGVIDINDVTNTPYEDRNHQLDDETIEVGEKARSLAHNLCENGMGREVESFFRSARTFYVAFVKTLVKKFPFGSTILCDLRILNPSERRTYKDFPAAVVRLAKCFPQLGLSQTEKLEELKTEAIDFYMADSADLPEHTDVDKFWATLHNVTQIGSTIPLYANLLVLVRALLAIPASNADSERCFSMVRKIDSEDRSHLERSTVASLLALKLNIDQDCFDYTPPPELLKLNKSAVWKYNQEHGSHN